MNRFQSSDYRRIKVVAFDADDTLWVNETFFRETEREFCSLLAPYAPAEQAVEALFRRETANMELYGYGVKACTLSMVETAIELGEGKLPASVVASIIELGRAQLQKPVVVLPGVQETLETLRAEYRLAVATKGDLLDQRRKLELSGLAGYFEHAEIMPDKHAAAYAELMNRLGVAPAEFLMVGNSVRSDVLPVLEAGGAAVHVPFEVTWQHEIVGEVAEGANFVELESLRELPSLLGR